MGHMIPMLELAKKFTHQNISSTLIVPDSGLHPDEEKLFLESLPKGIINLIHLPKPKLDDVQTDPIGVIIFTIARSLPSIRDAIRSLVATTNLVALVTDLMGSAAFDVARELDVLPYMFFPSNATVLSLYLYLPELDPNISCAYKDLAGPVQIPGCMPLRADDLFEAFKDRDSFAYKWIISEGRAYRTAAGVLVNTFDEMESGAIKALQQNEHYPPLKIAIRIQTKIRNCKNAGNDEDGEEGLIGRNEIAGVVESLMEGEPGKELRKRARGLMQAAKLAVNPGGQSAKSLLDFVLHLDRN
ncbi:OLC1v1038411C2 [Oldenlandia corymbosa var. corymbosa]|nr:OLC1v1038411C2 [Oldenlandia corymbosa var. corymbosa]